MRPHLIAIATLGTALFFAPQALAQAPQITSLSSSSIARNGKIVIAGSSFGAAPALSPDARVEIGGVRAATAQWSDGRIVAYPTESMPVGNTTIRVVASTGASAAIPITIDPLPATQGNVAWKIQSDGSAFRRPTVGSDGTVYAADGHGFVYALSPSGLVRWIYDGIRWGGHDDGASDEGPIAVGADGTVYVAIDPLGPDIQLHAIHPDGTLRWIHAESWSMVVSGPNIGPGGDIYFATTAPEGAGVQRISPVGSRIWSQPGDPMIDDAYYERSMDIVFGPGRPGGVVDRLYFAVDLGDLYDADPSRPMLYGYGVDGTQRFSKNVGSLSASFGALRGQASVGASGTVYLSSWYLPDGWKVHAYDPSGSKVWSWSPSPGNIVSAAEPGSDGSLYVTHDGAYLTALDKDGSEVWEMTMGGYHADEAPVLSPDGKLLFIDNSKMDNGVHGAMAAFSAAGGALLFRMDLPKENGTYQAMARRARFAPSTNRAYVATHFGGQPAGEQYGYLWALDLGSLDPGSTTGNSDAGTSTSSGDAGGAGTGGTSSAGDGGASAGEPPGPQPGGCSTSRGPGGVRAAALAALVAAACLIRRRASAHRDRRRAGVSKRSL